MATIEALFMVLFSGGGDFKVSCIYQISEFISDTKIIWVITKYIMFTLNLNFLMLLLIIWFIKRR